MKLIYYRPQRSWGKVIFSQAFVILLTGGGGRAWLLLGGGGRAWDTTRYGDTINERAVRILLECILVQMIFTSNICLSIVHAIRLQFNNTKGFCHRCKRLSGRQFFAFHIALYIYLTPKVFYTEAKSNTKANFFLWSSSLLNANIKLDSLWTHLEVIALSLQ